MSAEIIYTVFVSSTFDDLREERGEVQKALLKSRCFPIGMELFPSSDDETWEFIKRQIDQADYYIVIIAGRYGSVGPDGISYSELEYDYARSAGKPTLAFIHADPGKIPVESSEQDPERRKRLEAFKGKARRAIVNTYTNPHELAMQVMASLVDLKDRRPAIGFIRADQTIDARRYADVLEENQHLKETISRLQPRITVFDGADEEISFNSVIVDQDRQGKGIDGSKRIVSSVQPLGQIFISVAEAIIDAQYTDYQISSYILKSVGGRNPEAPDESRSFEDSSVFTDLRRKLFGARLVELHPMTTGDRFFRRTYNEWRLTEYGQAQYGVLTHSTPQY